MYETLLRPDDVEERCGLLMRDGSVIEVSNVASMPQSSFEMDVAALLPYLDDAVATWHTHPDGPSNLSGEDHKGFLRWPKLEHMVISPTGVTRYKVVNGAVIECD